MKAKRVVSYITCIIFVALALYLSYFAFPYSIATAFPDDAGLGERVINPSNTTLIESTVPNLVWDFRSLDLLIQVTLIFAATIALALFFKRYRVEEGE